MSEFNVQEYLASLDKLAQHLDNLAAECEQYAANALTNEDRKADEAYSHAAKCWAVMVRGEMKLCRFLAENMAPGMVDPEAECRFLGDLDPGGHSPSEKAADLLALALKRGAFDKARISPIGVPYGHFAPCFGERPPGYMPETHDVQPGDCKEG